LIIDHHLDLIKNSHWVIDLGPGAGEKGGELVAAGSPEDIAGNPSSVTGKFLAGVLDVKSAGAAAA
jgi:excinuclease ABC subunit A